MNTKISKTIKIMVFTVVLFTTVGCALTAPKVRVGDLRTESESVELGDVNSVDVEIFMGAGELDISGGSNKLMDANFTYNVAELEPEVDYSGGKQIVKFPEPIDDKSFDTILKALDMGELLKIRYSKK